MICYSVFSDSAKVEGKDSNGVHTNALPEICPMEIVHTFLGRYRVQRPILSLELVLRLSLKREIPSMDIDEINATRVLERSTEPFDFFSKTTLSVVRCNIGKNNILLSDERVITDEIFGNRKYSC